MCGFHLKFSHIDLHLYPLSHRGSMAWVSVYTLILNPREDSLSTSMEKSLFSGKNYEKLSLHKIGNLCQITDSSYSVHSSRWQMILKDFIPTHVERIFTWPTFKDKNEVLEVNLARRFESLPFGYTLPYNVCKTMLECNNNQNNPSYQVISTGSLCKDVRLPRETVGGQGRICSCHYVKGKYVMRCEWLVCYALVNANRKWKR